MSKKTVTVKLSLDVDVALRREIHASLFPKTVTESGVPAISIDDLRAKMSDVLDNWCVCMGERGAKIMRSKGLDEDTGRPRRPPPSGPPRKVGPKRKPKEDAVSAPEHSKVSPIRKAPIVAPGAGLRPPEKRTPGRWIPGKASTVVALLLSVLCLAAPVQAGPRDDARQALRYQREQADALRNLTVIQRESVEAEQAWRQQAADLAIFDRLSDDDGLDRELMRWLLED